MNILFTPSSLSGLTLPTRILRSATHEGMGDEHGHADKKLLPLYERLASNRVGAIISGYVAVQQSGKATRHMRMFHTDEYIADYLEMNNVMQSYGVPLILQLAHGGGQCSPAVTGEDVVAPSAIKLPNYPNKPRALNESEIEAIITDFVLSVERAQKAGFAGVQLHAAHGYLLAEFFSPSMNRRTDRWGGSMENRFRIVGEILRQARQKVGDYPIWIKISATDSLRNGMRLEQAIQLARLLEESGCDAIEVSCGSGDGFNTIRVKDIPAQAALQMVPRYARLAPWKKRLMKSVAPYFFKQHKPLYNYNVEAAHQIKQQVKLPVIVVGGIRRLVDIETIVTQGKADYVALCRPFIIEPGIVAKFASGKQTVSRCQECGFCLLGVSSHPLRCYNAKIPH